MMSIVAFDMDLVAIYLGQHASEHPLSRVYSQTRALHVLAVGLVANIFFVIAEHPIIRAVVRNLEEFIGH